MLSRTRRDERGSVALVVMVIFVMATLAAVMVTRNAGDLRQSVIESHQAAADAAADLGIARAVARVQAGESSEGFTDRGAAGDATWTTTGRLVGDGQWQLVSTGTSDTSNRSISTGLIRRNDRFWSVADWHRIPAQAADADPAMRRSTLVQRRRKAIAEQRRMLDEGGRQDLLQLFR